MLNKETRFLLGLSSPNYDMKINDLIFLKNYIVGYTPEFASKNKMSEEQALQALLSNIVINEEQVELNTRSKNGVKYRIYKFKNPVLEDLRLYVNQHDYTALLGLEELNGDFQIPPIQLPKGWAVIKENNILFLSYINKGEYEVISMC